jgi:hypothetical protein
MRKPLGHINIDPTITNVFLDSCAFDPKYHPEDSASVELHQMFERGKLILHIAHSNQKEIEHPNTPTWVKREANKFIFTYEVQLTIDEIRKKKTILQILTGDGDPESMRADAEHVFEASKYGTYFVTTDSRILKKKGELYNVCGIMVLKPSEIMDIIQSCRAET